MVATQTMAILSAESLIGIGQSFFAAQRFGEAWECHASLDELAATILDRREQLREVVATAPRASFGPQRWTQQGSPTWTAGQCADHVVNAQYGVSEPAIIALMTADGLATFEQPMPAAEIPSPPLLDRAAALARLDTATDDYQRLLDSIPRDVPPTTTLKHRYFGAIDMYGMLVISAWHEQSHTSQIERLAQQSRLEHVL